jgi:peptidoglycan-associated lipoprotein
VKNFLANQGIDVGRLTTISYGKERPAVEGSDEAAWAQNRRAVTMVMR